MEEVRCVKVSDRYVCGEASDMPDWSRLTDRHQLTGFLQKLDCCKVGPEGQLQKLNALRMGLRFLKVNILKDKPEDPLHQYAS